MLIEKEMSNGHSLVLDYLNPYPETSKIDSRSQDVKLNKKAFNARVDLSESDFKQGRFKSSAVFPINSYATI
jgi:hypothetical protein